MQLPESADLQRQVRSLLVALVRLTGAREAAVFRVHARTHDLALVAATDGFVAPLRWLDAVWKRQRAELAAGRIWRSGEHGVAPLVDRENGAVTAVVFFEGADDVAFEGRFREIASLLATRVQRMTYPDLRDFLLGEHEEPLPSAVQTAEAQRIRQALIQNSGHVSRCARELGLGRTTLYERMRALCIEPRLYRLPTTS